MKRLSAVLRPYIQDGAKVMLVMFLSLAMLFFLAYILLAVFHRYPLDYGEAPLVDQAMRLAAGQNIYRTDLSSPPYTVSNYPPLYPLALALFVKLSGPSFLAGRVISILSTLASALVLRLIIKTFTQDRLAANITAMFFLAIPYVVYWSPLLRVDMLALALSLTGLYVLVRGSTTRRDLVVSSLLLVAAVFTRQSYILAAPLAAFVWLWTNDKRNAITLAALVGAMTILLFITLNVITQGGFYFNVITANVNEFDIERLEDWMSRLRGTAPILLYFGGAFLLLAPGRVRSWPLLVPYLIGASLSALTIGKIGSNANYLLELSAALSLVAGAVVAWSRGRSWIYAAILILLTLQTGQLMQYTLSYPVDDLKSRLKPSKELKDLEWIVQTADDPAMADEFMGFFTLENRPLYIQPFEVTQLAEAGLWDQSDLLDSIRQKEFSVILIHHYMGGPAYKERWTPEMLSAIMQNYHADQFRANSIVFRPNEDSEVAIAELGTCPNAPWRLPTRGDFGMWWDSKQLYFMGEGDENTVPVYAVADGLLTRGTDWVGSVAIQHQDPLREGEKIWTFYDGMAGTRGWESFIVADYPPGSVEVPVKAGQLLGYQGIWSREFDRNIWVHLHFALVYANPEDGSFPSEKVGLEVEDGFLEENKKPEYPPDPSLYLGTIGSQIMGDLTWLSVQCQENTP
jgi:hypothetical protein